MRRATTSHNNEYQSSIRSDGSAETLHIKRTHAASDTEYLDDPQDKSKVHVTPGSSTPKGYVGLGGSIPKDVRQNTHQSVLNLVNNILGAGVLGYPYCFKSCGLVLATCLMLVSGIACRLSYQLLLYCAHLTNTKSYEEICERSLGKLGRQIVELCTAALNIGAVVAYINILADVLSAVAGTIIPPGAEPSRDAYVAGVALFGVLPVSVVVRDSSVISAFSTASLGLVAVFAVVVTIFALGPNAAATGPIHVWKPEGLLVAFPVMAYGFTGHPYYLSIYSTLQSPNIRRMTRVTDLAMAVIAVLYWIVGVSGYMSFRHRTAGDLLRNFGAPTVLGLRGAYERGLKLCYGLSILGSVPGVIMPFHRTLESILGYTPVPSMKNSLSDVDLNLKDKPASSQSRLAQSSAAEEDELPFAQHVLVCLMVVGLGMASALWVPNVEFIFGLMGATAAVLIAYIIPSVSFLRVLGSQPELAPQKNTKAIMVPDEVKWQWRKRKWVAMGLLVFGIVSGIACTDAIISAVHEEAAVVQLAQELVADQAMAAETANVAMKAKEAATTVSAVREAAKGLQIAKQNTTATLGTLQSAAAQLTALANSSTHNKPPTATWDLRAKYQEHKKAAAEAKVLSNIEADLVAVRRDINSTIHQVLSMVDSMDAAMAQIQSQSQTHAAEPPNQPGSVPASNPTAKVGAEEMAKELAHALGIYANAYNASATSAKNLEQVRHNAIAAVGALNDTLFVLEHVSLAISLAMASPEHNAKDVRTAAVTAMQKALTAIEASGLALNMTGNALQHTASTEASQLLKVLTKMVQEVDKSKNSDSSVPDKAASKTDVNTDSTTSNSATDSHSVSHHQDIRLTTNTPPPPAATPPDASPKTPSMDPAEVGSKISSISPKSDIPGTVLSPAVHSDAANNRMEQDNNNRMDQEHAAVTTGSQAMSQPLSPPQHVDVQEQGAGGHVSDGSAAVKSSGEESGVGGGQDTAQAATHHAQPQPRHYNQHAPDHQQTSSPVLSSQQDSSTTISNESPSATGTVGGEPHKDTSSTPDQAAAQAPSSNTAGSMKLPLLGGDKNKKSALTPEQMEAVEGIIKDLENLDNAASTGAASSQGVDQLLQTNFTALASAIQSAAQWSADSRETALQKISGTLSKSHTKVATRVMEFIQDLNKAEKDATKDSPITPQPDDNTDAGKDSVPPVPPSPASSPAARVSLRQKAVSITDQVAADQSSNNSVPNNSVHDTNSIPSSTAGVSVMPATVSPKGVVNVDTEHTGTDGGRSGGLEGGAVRSDGASKGVVKPVQVLSNSDAETVAKGSDTPPPGGKHEEQHGTNRPGLGSGEKTPVAGGVAESAKQVETSNMQMASLSPSVSVTTSVTENAESATRPETGAAEQAVVGRKADSAVTGTSPAPRAADTHAATGTGSARSEESANSKLEVQAAKGVSKHLEPPANQLKSNTDAGSNVPPHSTSDGMNLPAKKLRNEAKLDSDAKPNGPSQGTLNGMDTPVRSLDHKPTRSEPLKSQKNGGKNGSGLDAVAGNGQETKSTNTKASPLQRSSPLIDTALSSNSVQDASAKVRDASNRQGTEAKMGSGSVDTGVKASQKVGKVDVGLRRPVSRSTDSRKQRTQGRAPVAGPDQVSSR